MADQPFSPVPLDDEHLAKYGKNAARCLKPDGSITLKQAARQVREDLRTLAQTVHKLSDRPGEGQPAAAEWLLDNHYLARRVGVDAAAALRRGKCVRRSVDESVVQVCARGAVWAAPELDQDRLALYLTQFQSEVPLTERELSLLAPALAWALLRRLAQLSQDAEALAEGGGDPAAFQALFAGLRALEAIHWGRFLESHSRLETLLRQDPTGDYPNMEENTRRLYRQQVCRLARRERWTEAEAAEEALELAQKNGRHIGFYLFTKPLGRSARYLPDGYYGAFVLLLTALPALMLGGAGYGILVPVLLFLPLSDIVKNCLDFILSHIIRPRAIPRMALEEGVPAEGRTLCVIAALLTGEESGKELAGDLERYRLANRDCGQELRFGILADLPDSRSPMDGQGRAWVSAAQKAIDALNQTYGGGFYLFFRAPAFQPQDEKYQGWERKRGALVELVRLLKGEPSGLKLRAGEADWLSGVRYVITLDSDTSLNVGAARELIGAMLHPLNQPEIDEKRQVVVRGYALLQPRVSVELEAANRSTFSRIFAGQGGVDPYGSTASDVYHDLFDQGTYTGKGIFQVDAFYQCLDRRLPDNRVLSHDLLEGSYLHAGLLGEVELSDGFPYQVNAYFARQHRWVRGDWQLFPWLLPKVPSLREGCSGREENPLSALARWKIFDNLRRSLSPIATLLALVLGICLSGKTFAVAGTAAVLSAASNLLLSGVELAARRGAGSHVRYHSTIIAGLEGAILQTLLQLVLLPCQAYLSLTAITAALWRMLVSKKNLLSWVTAAQTMGKKGSLWSYFRSEWFSLAVGLGTLLGAQLRIGMAVGFVWMCAPAIAWALSQPKDRRGGVSQSDRAFLLHQAGLIWDYFDTFLRPQDNWLPPDNWQERPAVGLARRTSPTNIGMALLSIVSAVDLDLLTQEKGKILISHMLDTLENLEKWKGHLYNWYSTETARPLEPRYVSTVDSGNLCASLIALREGLYEWGEAELARRAERLSEAMAFAPLYDRERKLFFIGWELERDKPTQGYYDLMASEARQTSYLAVARGEVDPRHWRRLGRMLLGENDYRGMASWTGTMFEYFMPNLLLPCEENSLMYESLAFCVYAQKRRGAKMRTPWGISESAFYAFDPARNYQYKAHGVQSLGLKRGLDQELVLSPYSSFLALLLAPRSAAANLRRLRDLGMEGRFGLYEAADFTPQRLTGEESFSLIRSYMSHHLGMSLVAIDNALNKNVMQKRFMRDRAMSAYRELLRERLPVGAPVARLAEREAPKKPERRAAPALLRWGEGSSRLQPACALLSSGNLTALAWDNGTVRLKLGGEELLHSRPGQWYAPAGISAFVRTADGLSGVTAAPLYAGEWQGRWEFDSACARWESQGVRLSLTLPPKENGAVYRAEIRAEEKPWKGELLFYLEPVLARLEDYQAHPAFSRLFLESKRVKNGVVFCRRPRGREQPPVLALQWDAPGEFSTSRERALGRGGLRALAHRDLVLNNDVGAVLDPCLLLKIPFALAPGESRTVRLALAGSDSEFSALASVQSLLQKSAAGAEGELAGLALQLGLSQREALEAFELLGRLTVPKTLPPQRELWPFGISGDVPIAAGLLLQEEELERAKLWCAMHQLLNRGGFAFDLALLLDEEGDYRRPLRTALTEHLKKLGAESALGAKGGVHLCDAKTAREIVFAHAAVCLPLTERLPVEDVPPPAPAAVAQELAGWTIEQDGTVKIFTGDKLPPVGWSQILCNAEFGWLTDETGNGLLWTGGNSREGALTRWRNDPLTVGGGERVEFNGVSVFADGDRLSCVVTYRPGEVFWEKELPNGRLTTRAWVPIEENRRNIAVYSDQPGTLTYRLEDGPPLAQAVRAGETWTLVNQSHWEKGRFPERTEPFWSRLQALTVDTPSQELNHYVNCWGLYQVTACRLFARTSQYQNGGAYGFRDQLQDVCALMTAAPALAREQILRCCARQFEEGDVQHWWHPPHGAGVRTRITDDLLWLPYAAHRYVQITGDESLWDEQVPYLHAPPLDSNQQQRYDTPEVSAQTGSVREHCQRAVQMVIDRGFGPHGLALMGAGDWNDGMDRVGERGRGESVWLTWFLALVLKQYPEYENIRRSCLDAAEHAWDGAWYRRGYYDDGTPLGSQENDQCAIDSIAQSFAVLAGGERGAQAVDAAIERLFDREHQLVKLFTPAFTGRGKDPGYIRGYLPGVRENGGQYTHGAVWLAIACLELGDGDRGWELLRALLPETHPTEIYRTEPYVIAADVYAAPGHEGRGGWSWYTGAAGWYYRAAVEHLLGLRVREGRLYVEPVLPQSWPGFTADWKLPGGKKLRVEVRRGKEPVCRLDGKRVENGVKIF